MRTLSTAFPLLILILILLVPLGCDSASLPEADPGELLMTDGLFPAHSRVFDGRDSVATGIDGLVATQSNFAIVTEFVLIEAGGDDDVGSIGITDPDNLDPSTPLFEGRLGNPVLAPDDDQVTWGEFSGARGAIIVKCTKKGTHVTVHLSGLIPKGVYSVWNAFGPLGAFADYAAMGSRGKSTGNAFQASARGEGHISGFVLPGGENAACLLDDVEASEDVWRVVGIYHIDGTPDLSEEGTFVEQVSFEFENEEDGGGEGVG